MINDFKKPVASIDHISWQLTNKYEGGGGKGFGWPSGTRTEKMQNNKQDKKHTEGATNRDILAIHQAPFFLFLLVATEALQHFFSVRCICRHDQRTCSRRAESKRKVRGHAVVVGASGAGADRNNRKTKVQGQKTIREWGGEALYPLPQGELYSGRTCHFLIWSS